MNTKKASMMEDQDPSIIFPYFFWKFEFDRVSSHCSVPSLQFTCPLRASAHVYSNTG
jgi:hypothetical protein